VRFILRVMLFYMGPSIDIFLNVQGKPESALSTICLEMSVTSLRFFILDRYCENFSQEFLAQAYYWHIFFVNYIATSV
jgi:hypothetical protein